jgi:hypothetical protein
VELVSRSLMAAVQTELDAIRRVYEQHGQRDPHGRVFAFHEIDIRSIVPLAESVPWRRLRELLPACRARILDSVADLLYCASSMRG